MSDGAGNAGRIRIALQTLSATMVDMASLGERILEAIRYAPLDDDVLAKRLGVSQRQSVNQTARRMEAQGLLRRIPGPDGKIVNVLPSQVARRSPHDSSEPVPTGTRGAPPEATVAARRDRFIGDRITEDEVKEAVRAYLSAEGFQVEVAWGHVPGIDVDARHEDGRRYVIEAKAEIGTAGPQQHNYFLGVLGELVQRMSDPVATYAIALPDYRQYRGLVDRLPRLARVRLRLAVFWVDRDGSGLAVTLDEAPA